MKKAIGILSIAATLAMIQSCTKVIEIDLNEADQKLVIEGYVYEGNSTIEVLLTRTTSYFDAGGPLPVDGATVKVTMPNASVITLTPAGDGYYRAEGVAVVNNATYALEVTEGGNTYTSTSYMPVPVPIDSLTQEFQEGIFGGEDSYNVFINYQDQFGKNFYRARAWVDGIYLQEPGEIQMFDDNLNDGNYIRIPLFVTTFQAGDTVEVELQSMSPETYEFFQTFALAASEDAGSPFTAAPANPETNIKGGALGVWAAIAVSRDTIAVVE
ncbi:MAG: DUF4249 domain-containing protein [Flavobacteriales bacterium]